MLREIVVDSFAGGGGASCGIEAAGLRVDIALNHDPEAVCMHKANHPHTVHFAQNINAVDPREVTQGRPVGLAWFSPDCKHFSKAKGGKPVEKRIRDLAWVVVHWAKLVRPRVICLENVEEFTTWGPLLEDGRPCPVSRGLEFRRWVRELRKLGYKVEWRELRACDYGAPTIRKRLFVIARCDGEKIVWPEPTHGPGLLPYRVAAECIDWSIPVRSIFERDRPLAEATCRRIARGIFRYVIDCANPFIVPYYGGDARVHGVDEPLRTQTSENRFGVVGPHIVPVTHHGDDRCQSIEEPLRTVTAAQRGEFAVVCPHLTGLVGRPAASRSRGVDEPISTVTARYDMGLIMPYLMKLQQNSIGHGLAEPFHTVMAGATRFAEVRALLAPFALTNTSGHPGASIAAPLSTVTTGGQQAIVGAFLGGCGGRAAQSRERGVDEPTATGTSKADVILVTPFGVPRYGERPGQEPRCQPFDQPLSTVVPTQNGASLCAAFMAQHNTGATGHPVTEPVSTICSWGSHQQLVTVDLREVTRSVVFGGNSWTVAYPRGQRLWVHWTSGLCEPALNYMDDWNAGRVGYIAYGPEALGREKLRQSDRLTAAWLGILRNNCHSQDVRRPAPTITAGGFHSATCQASLLAITRKNTVGQDLREPFNTLTASNHFQQVCAFLQTYYGTEQDTKLAAPLPTATTKDRFGLVTVAGVDYQIVDIGMRMLAPKELFKAQGFPSTYKIDPIYNGKPLTKTAQVRMCGNSVCPPLAEAIVRANVQLRIVAPPPEVAQGDLFEAAL